MYSVNAADFGFLPQNSGDENARVLQSLCDRRGTIVIDRPGEYRLSRTVELESDTSLIFGAGVTVRRSACDDGVFRQGYVFVNRGAFQRKWNERISITGLRLVTDRVRPSSGFENGAKQVIGLNAHLAFFYIKDLTVRDFELNDLAESGFGIQVCTFENVILENLRIEGMKDAVHFGKGSGFVVRHGIFRTYDDPIALNANDYSTSNPQMGWIENGLIEDCYDLDQPETTGFFARILAGAWREWTPGMTVQHSDSVLSGGRLYRVVMRPDGETYVSRTRPDHADGVRELDGIRWAMVQDDDPTDNCGCRNIRFRDIFLLKKRPVAFAMHFDNDHWSRSYYPNSRAPVQRNILFENIFVLNQIPTLLMAKTPADAIRFVNCAIEHSTVELKAVDAEGIAYGETRLLFSGCEFKGNEDLPLVLCREKRSAAVRISGSVPPDPSAVCRVAGDVRVVESDIPLLAT